MISILKYFADDELEKLTTKHQHASDFEDIPDEASLQDFEVLGIKSVNVYKACLARGEYTVLVCTIKLSALH